ncbi:MAG: hypothetical protein JWL66_1377 [Sphingomonadales bacterium]|nr:hypothetical protein [Sphingomonadales bacterium]
MANQDDNYYNRGRSEGPSPDRSPERGRDNNGYGAYGARGGNRDRQITGDRDQYRNRDDSDRGFLDRAGDEVRSWFGDDDAERRRERDNRDSGTPDYNNENYGRGGTRGGALDGSSRSRQADHDPHYSNWRQQQIDALDRDYHEYRQHSQAKFENDFGTWRSERQSQRSLLDQVEKHHEVVGSDGEHVGTVDKVKGDRIILTRNDVDAGGHHHSIPSIWLKSADGGRVTISKTAAEAKQAWRDEDRNTVFGSNNDRGNQGDSNDGPHVLNRSFSGTY